MATIDWTFVQKSQGTVPGPDLEELLNDMRKIVGKNSRWLNLYSFFFKKNIRYPVWTCRDSISLILGSRF